MKILFFTRGKIAIFLLLIAFMVCCGTPYEKGTGSVEQEITVGADNVTIIRVDGCQYLFWREYYKGAIEHKGDCDNPYHKKQ